MDFKECCFEVEDIKKVLEDINRFFESWLDFSCNLYNTVAEKKKVELLSNVIVATFFREIQETMDGIRVLLSASCVKPATPLIRMLLELYIGMRFILKGEEKMEIRAEAHELFFLRQALNVELLPKESKEQIQSEYDKFNSSEHECIKEKLNNQFIKWYETCEGDCSSFKKLCDFLGEKVLYEQLYGELSKVSHGYMSRKGLLQDSCGNFLAPYRWPLGLANNFNLCHLIFVKSIGEFARKYCNDKEIDELLRFMNTQKNAANRIVKMIKLIENSMETENGPVK